MALKISVVVNTLNEEKNIARAIKSVSWADEILVCDMYSDDKTAEIAKILGAKVFFHKRVGYVEPARNFTISKASNNWVLILDADEEIPLSLADKIKKMVAKPITSDYVRIPRKNIIFGKWMKATMWWPDYNIRLFKKGKVAWSGKIHIPPKSHGQGLDLPAEEKYAIIHNHYNSLEQYINRMNRYTFIQAKDLMDEGYKFSWKDLIKKPLGEFLSRFFANRGFDDGLHGLALSLLQGFSHLVLYLKVWEMEKFRDYEFNLKDLKEVTNTVGEQINYWLKYGNLSKNPFKRFLQRLQNKF